MFWTICIIVLAMAFLIGIAWGDISNDSIVAGAFICGGVAFGVLVVTLVFVAAFGPKEGASSIDYIIEDVGGDMYYVDDRGSHKVEIDSRFTPHFSDVKYPTYRVTTYSWENWPHFPDAELLIPEAMRADG